MEYEYDAEERITSVIDKYTLNGKLIETVYEYTYDTLGQLLTESVNGVAINTMTYDNYGNIRTRNGKTYTYGDSKWKDLLTEYDGQTITYDDGGNPINYLGHTLAWEKGRQLKSFDDITYTYNANGIRTSKTVNGIEHKYTLDGTNIVKETWDGNALVPLYDNTESVCGITYNGASYYFLKNLQGDVIAITDATGTVIARYSYDAWGVCTIESDTTDCSIAEINPYRYRSYYFDQEIGMYYLQSRYYDPQVGRFINADDAQSIVVTSNILANNSFAYCCNNIVNEIDQGGNLVLTIIKKILLGVFKGLFKQLCTDFILWVFSRIFNKSSVEFKISHPATYISSIMSAILKEFSLAGIVGMALSIISVLIKYIPKIVSGRMDQSDWLKLLLQIVTIVLETILTKELKSLKTKRTQIHKKMADPKYSRNLLRLESKRINLKIHYVGITLSLYLPISKGLLNALITLLF